MIAKKTVLNIKKSKSEPLIRDLYLEPASTSSMSARLTTEFIKFLCFQKGQIPVTFSQLESQVRFASKELEGRPDLASMKSRERMALMNQRRRKAGFVRKADQFIQSLTEINKTITEGFFSSREKIVIVLGTSVFNPKEVYILDFSCWRDSANDSGIEEMRNLKRNLSNFFRDLVISEDMFSFFQPIRPTGIAVMFRQNPKHAVHENCLPRLNYQIPLRGKQFMIRILPKNQIGPVIHHDSYKSPHHVNDFRDAVSRRLIFNSPVASSKRKVEHLGNCLDISGITQLEEDPDASQHDHHESGLSDESCWFQIRSVLKGFECQM